MREAPRGGVSLLLALAVGAVLTTVPTAATPKKKSPRSAKSGNHYEPHNIEPIFSVRDFKDKVTTIVNNSNNETVEGPPEYFPAVFFHVSWCDHCRAAMPELDKAAGELLDHAQNGAFAVPPKFYSVQCDKAPKGITELCDKYVGTKFPSLYLFREKRAFRFIDRPRTQQIYRWWISRVIRPFLVSLEDMSDVWSSKEPIFLMKASENDTVKLEIWYDIAANHLDSYTFAIVDPSSAAGKDMDQDLQMWAPPSEALSPLPFNGDLSDDAARDIVEAWLNVNRFPAIGSFKDARVVHSYQAANARLVIMVHGAGKAGKQARKQFSGVVKAMRPSAKYVFAAVNASHTDEKEVLQWKFPLLAPGACRYPRIFGIQGDAYFEDPALSDIANLSEGNINALFASAEARQGSSWADWFKAKRKLYTRFASESATNMALAVAMPVLVLVILYLLGKLFFESLSDDDEAVEEVEKKKSK